MRVRITLRFLAMLAMLAMLASACAGAAPPRSNDGRQAEKAVLDFVQSEMRERQIPGLQLVVIKNRKVILSKALGLANIQHNVPVTESSLFSINSATKSFTGVAAMQLAERGKLDIDAPLSRYLESLPLAWQSVTVTQLLNHTSGIPDIIDRATGKMFAGGSDAAWRAVQALPMEFIPGQRFSYNQTNYLLLGKIIDRLAGEPFLTFFQRNQLDAAGMSHTGFGDGHDVVRNKANSYLVAGDGSGLKNVFEEFPAFLKAGAGINTSANELAQWLIALQQGNLLKAPSLRRLWMPTTFTDGKPAPWSLGWPTIGRAKHRAVAGIGGARSAFYVYPDDDLAVILLTNLSGAQPEQLIDAIAGFYLPALREINGSAYTLSRLRESVAKSGFDDIDRKLAQSKLDHGAAEPSENDLNAWGYRLLSQQRRKPAISVLSLATRLYPASANAHDSLAEAYEADGAAELAIRHYRRSLELDPSNKHAVERLDKLEASDR